MSAKMLYTTGQQIIVKPEVIQSEEPLQCAAETCFCEHTCSMSVQASFRVSAIFKRTMTTESRLRQKADVESFSSCTRLFLVVMTPMA